MNLFSKLDNFIVRVTEPVRQFERRNATPLMREAEALQNKLASLLASTWSTDPQD
jgi:hypothetical protein